MIIATVTLKGREEKRKEIMQTIAGMTDQVKRMEGCLDIHSYQDLNDSNIFYQVGKWQTQEALDIYLNSKFFSALLGARTILEDMPTVQFMTIDRPFRNSLKEQNGVTR